MQVIDARHGLVVDPYDDVSRPEAGASGGARLVDARYEHTALRFQTVCPNREPQQRHVLPRDADLAAPDLAMPDELAGHELGGVDPHREADPLSRKDHRRVHADDKAPRIDERPAGVARIERRVGLDHVVDEAPPNRPELASQDAYHTCRHRTLTS